MSSKEKTQTEVEQQVIDLTIQLIHLLRSKRTISYNEMGMIYSERVKYPHLYEEQELFQKIVAILRKHNPHISRSIIITSFIGEVVGHVVFNYDYLITDNELADKAREKIKALITYSENRDVDIPIEHLDVDGLPIKFGRVTFHPISACPKELWEKITLNYYGNVEFAICSFARVISPGDHEYAIDNALKTVQETLLVLRGIGFPITTEEITQFGMLNEFNAWRSLPIYVHKPEEKNRLDNYSGVTTRIGPPIKIYKLYADLINSVNKEVIASVNKLLNLDEKIRICKMNSKFINGLRWLGEATKPDALQARFIKLSNALEYLIGGEAKDELLTTRGITATLAERAAFLIGKDEEHRLLIDREIRRLYGLRSKIVHGGKNVIGSEDFEKFGSYVREIALSLCLELKTIKTIDDMQKWILKKRYT